MIGFLLKLNNFERIMLVFGVLSLTVYMIYFCIGRFERYEQGISKKKSGTSSVLIVMGSLSVFSFSTLFITVRGYQWYIAYPVAVMTFMVYAAVSMIYFGRTPKIKPLRRNVKVAIGHIGVVFKPISPDSSSGCVSVDVFGQTIEAYAISADNEPIQSGTVIKVIDSDEDKLVCRPLKQDNNR